MILKILFVSVATLIIAQNIQAQEIDETISIMPSYGNWCGPSYPKNPESAGDPIDALDEICKKHDLCYAEKGYLSCECDSDFNRQIVSGLNNDEFMGAEKIVARSFRAYFRVSPCDGDGEYKLAPTRAIQNVVGKAADTTKSLVNKLPIIGE